MKRRLISMAVCTAMVVGSRGEGVHCFRTDGIDLYLCRR